MPSSLKKPLLTAKPDGKKLILKFVTEIRILSAALAQLGGAPTDAMSDNTARNKFFIWERNLSVLAFLSSFENRLRNGAVAANVAAQSFGSLFAGEMQMVNQRSFAAMACPGV